MGVQKEIEDLISNLRRYGYNIRKLEYSELEVNMYPIFHMSSTHPTCVEFLEKELLEYICDGNFNYSKIRKIFDMHTKISVYGYIYTRSKGYCMYPLINSNQLVKIIRINKEAVGCNDVILFVRDGNIYLHRIYIIIKKYDNETYFITKGDNAILYDRLVSKEQIIGKLC